MKGHCDIQSCKYFQNYSKDVSYHRVPVDKDLHKKWLHFFQQHGHDIELGKQRPRICDLHFTEDSFERDFRSELMYNLPKMKLKKNAVPTFYKVPKKKKNLPDMKKTERKAIVEKILKEHEDIIIPHRVFNHQEFLKLDISSGINENNVLNEPELFEPKMEFLDIAYTDEPEKLFTDSAVQCDLLEELWEESVKNNKESKTYKCLNDFLDMIGKPRRASFCDIEKFETKTEYETIMLGEHGNEMDTIIIPKDAEYENINHNSIVANTEFENIDKVDIAEYDTKTEYTECEGNAYDTKLDEYDIKLDEYVTKLDEYEEIDYDESTKSEKIIKKMNIPHDESDTEKDIDEEDICNGDDEFNQHFIITPKIINYEDVCIQREDGYYQCRKCNKLARTRPGIMKHNEVHSEQSLICAFCGALFHNHRKMVQHTSICRFNSRKNTFDSQIQINEIAQNLIKQRKNKIRHICTICDKEFKRDYILNDHINSHTKEKPYKCSCGTKFGHMENFRTHLRNMSNKNTMCPIPGRIIPSYAPQKFLYTNEVESRPRKDETDKKQVNIKGKKLGRQRKVIEAKDLIETTESLKPEEIFLRKFNCTICNRAFANKPAVKKHQKLHLEKKFECDQCTQKFHSATLLKIHVVNSHNIRKKCEHCNKIFSPAKYSWHLTQIAGNKVNKLLPTQKLECIKNKKSK